MSTSARILPVTATEPTTPFFDVDNIEDGASNRATAIPILSLFSGAGMLDLGFEQAEFNIVYRNELDPVFARSSEYAWRNMGRPSHGGVDVRSIVDIGPRDLLKRAFGVAAAPSSFGLIGGPPCPDFSIGGKNKGGTGERGYLTELYVNRILELLPLFFVLENVKGLVSTKKHRLFLETQLERLRDRYTVSHRVLNALDFGVPQDRERVFLVGFRKPRSRRATKCGTNPEYKWPRSLKYAGAKARYPWPDKNPFGARIDKPSDIPLELTVWGAIGDSATLEMLPNAADCFRPYSAKFSQIDEGDDYRKSFKRLHRWRYSPTAAYGNNEVHLHPSLPRRISVREAMRLQTVPDDYAFPPDVPLSAKFKMIGNAVPVRLASALAKSIQAHLAEIL